MTRSLRFALYALGMGAAMATALDNLAVGIALGVGMAAAISGRRDRRCPPSSPAGND